MKRIKIFNELTRDIECVNKPLIALTILKVLALFLELIPLYIYSFFINQVLISNKINRFWIVVGGYIVVYFFSTIQVALSKRFSNKLILNYDLRIKSKLLRKYFSFDYDTYCNFSVGDVKSRIEEDSIAAESFFKNHLLDFVYSFFSAFTLSAILIWYDWKMAFWGFVFLPPAFFVVDKLGNKAKNTNEKIWKLQTNYEKFLHSTFQNWKDIKINNLEDIQYDALNKHYVKIKKVWFRNQFYLHLGTTFSYFVTNFITQLYIYFIGGWFVIRGYSQIGTLLIFIKFYGQFFGYIQKILNSITSFKNDSVRIEKVIEILNYKIETKPYKKISHTNIIVKNVKFKYKENSPYVLNDISFTAKEGEHIAIIGESGSGKSTLAKLLIGQIGALAGSINYGEIDISDVSLDSIAEKVSIVVQEPCLFNMTIRDNLLLVKDDATEAEIMECCRKASISDFIENMPDKLDTIIGENGVKLSGGQKQRLAIARVFLQDRDVIIFDESTSALDNEKESEIMTELMKLPFGKTVIFIAHRFSTILRCNRILVLKDGMIVGDGTHESLYQNNETYDLLYNSQLIENKNLTGV